MALPEYFGRNAVAVSQAISGLDEERLQHQLQDVIIGITVGPEAKGFEGRAIADLVIRLLARLYPKLVVRSVGAASVSREMQELATQINPRIEFGGDPTLEVVIGTPRLKASSIKRIFVGSNGWEARVSTTGPLSCGSTDIPIGPGLAACVAAANVFRSVFVPDAVLDIDARLNPVEESELARFREQLQGTMGRVVLVGAGAIGNAAAWALSRVTMEGTLDIVDHESVDMGNLQRYVLAERRHVDAAKAPLLAEYFQDSVQARAFETDLASYLQSNGYDSPSMLLALDSARDRRAAQASLPQWVANAWTQPGDVGVSTHDFVGGACVSCLYLPDKSHRNEDEVIAEAFGVPDRLMEVRTLLFRREGAPRTLLEAIATARGLDFDRLLPFEGRPLRSLYTEGFCGGAVIPLGEVGTPRADVHVPLAHQSALAGVLLAAAAVRHALGGAEHSRITQLDLLKPLPVEMTRPAAKHPSGRCICQDTDYRQAYASKYAQASDPAIPAKPEPAMERASRDTVRRSSVRASGQSRAVRGEGP
ncbi:E2 ligase fold family C protein [Burkholderia pseudomallei]|uniref:E2 ligase fold family C protein n=1 Tax=Burkholderia pseudomallei TaxID=28450 RepID=UPI00014F9903|nr:E2 ligase fold family C protein [Burkholderia pseudomallei]AGR71941.1 thiF family protein [Burkholderia pseudomallei MSHR305]AHK64108.1 thiF family protein [Burkholderia pseudomallei MSHR520]AIP78312.1 thiF family protein [Burkholderia pseudomallei]APZ18601.1 hypothetical protein BGI47_08025 [Burkholderia pseudomallei]APZ24795.1 hypothetical protein BGI46_08020 [Burkholderia pseudomallei]